MGTYVRGTLYVRGAVSASHLFIHNQSKPVHIPTTSSTSKSTGDYHLLSLVIAFYRSDPVRFLRCHSHGVWIFCTNCSSICVYSWHVVLGLTPLTSSWCRKTSLCCNFVYIFIWKKTTNQGFLLAHVKICHFIFLLPYIGVLQAKFVKVPVFPTSRRSLSFVPATAGSFDIFHMIIYWSQKYKKIASNNIGILANDICYVGSTRDTGLWIFSLVYLKTIFGNVYISLNFVWFFPSCRSLYSSTSVNLSKYLVPNSEIHPPTFSPKCPETLCHVDSVIHILEGFWACQYKMSKLGQSIGKS